MLDASIIVPVYNHAEELRQCLSALSKQTYSQEKFEVFVVDNESETPLKGIVESYQNVQLVREPRHGSYAARNTGVKASSGSILAFTDADCRPDPDWLEAGVRCLRETKNCGLVAGKVDLTFADPDRPNPYEWYDRLNYLDQELAMRRGNYGATANLFTRREVVKDVGPFDAELVSGGDNEWGQRVHQHGYRQVYCDKAVVCHPARNSFKSLLRKELRVAGGLAQIRKKQEKSVASTSRSWDVQLRFWKKKLRRLAHPVRSALGVLVGSTSNDISSWGIGLI